MATGSSQSFEVGALIAVELLRLKGVSHVSGIFYRYESFRNIASGERGAFVELAGFFQAHYGKQAERRLDG
jgi:hypothetical protein